MVPTPHFWTVVYISSTQRNFLESAYQINAALLSLRGLWCPTHVRAHTHTHARMHAHHTHTLTHTLNPYLLVESPLPDHACIPWTRCQQQKETDQQNRHKPSPDLTARHGPTFSAWLSFFSPSNPQTFEVVPLEVPMLWLPPACMCLRCLCPVAVT